MNWKEGEVRHENSFVSLAVINETSELTMKDANQLIEIHREHIQYFRHGVWKHEPNVKVHKR